MALLGCVGAGAGEVAAAASPAATPPASTPGPRPALPAGVVRGPSVEGITEYRLANGMRVLLFPDPSSATFLANITYLVGSRHENYGERGMAHLLEHLLFRRSAAHPSITRALAERGASANGTTWHDRTNYFATFAPSEDNLRWVIAMEADRMVNAAITREELDPEMSVVRNEFERGEDNPTRVLIQRVASAAYLWHNYGNETIGARSDIENVPIERLQAFYRRWYRPDNAVFLLAGRFDEALALELAARHFGAIARPAEPLERTYTVEPVQDGERQVTLRRIGESPTVVAAYHVPAGSHPDSAAIDLLTEVLRAPPSGRLHRALVDGGRAVSVFGFDQQLREPGLVFFGARAAAGRPIEAVRDTLLETLEGLAREPITEAEVQRARTVLLRQLEQSLATPVALGRTMSEWIANGDWRLFFLHRNRLRSLGAADVNRVARDYLKRANRTVGLFIPDPAPDRAEIPPAPDLESLLARLAPDPELAAGESFDPTPENIERRTLRQRLPAGLDLAMLPRATRGQLVHAQLNLRFGDERTLIGRQAEASLLAALLQRGTRRLDRQRLRDAFDRMGTQVSVSGSATGVSVSLRTVREHLAESLALVVDMLREPALPARDLEELRAEALAGIDRQRQDPASLGSLAYRQHTERYPRGDPRHVPSLDEQAADLRAVTLAGMRDFHRRFYGASSGQFSLVGDFDPEAIATLAARLLGEWRSETPWSRVADLYQRVEPRRIVIETPDRANAWFRTGMNLELSSDDADYPALLIAGQMLGGGFLSSRLAERVRHREGLSYSVWARFDGGSPGRSGSFMASAIFAPENAARLERAVREELERALADGFTEAEVAAARAGYLQSVQVARGNDARLTAALASNADLGRTYRWQGALDARIAALTAADVNAALRRHLDLGQLSTVLAGDFAAAAARPESLRTAPASSPR